MIALFVRPKKQTTKMFFGERMGKETVILQNKGANYRHTQQLVRIFKETMQSETIQLKKYIIYTHTHIIHTHNTHIQSTHTVHTQIFHLHDILEMTHLLRRNN